MTSRIEHPIDRHGKKTEPTSVIHNYINAAEDNRLIKAYLGKHYSLLTTVQLRELDEIFGDSERSRNERTNS